MKLRWHTFKTNVTAQQVKEYANEANITLMQAKKALENQSATVLQYQVDDGFGVKWIDVPHIVEYL